MTQLTHTLIFFLISLSIHSQIQWENIPVPNRSSFIILDVVDSSTIYALKPIDNKIVVSNDNGITWEDWYEGPLTQGMELLNFNFVLRPDSDGKQHLLLENEVYQYDTTNQSFTRVGPPSFIDDIDFLDNGNIILASGDELFLLDSNWQIINQHNTRSHRSKILKGEGDQHFLQIRLGANTFVMGFNSDFTNFTPVYDAPKLNSLDNYIYKNGRLFSDSYYSDNGEDWHLLPQIEEPSYIFVNNNNVIYLIADDFIYYSSDNGDSFESFDIDLLTNDIKWATHRFLNDANQVFIQNRRCINFSTFISDYNRSDHRDVSDRFQHGPSFAQKVAASAKDNILIATCELFDLLKPSLHEPWQPIQKQSSGFEHCPFGKNMHATTNHNLISSSGCVSVDGGHHWSSKLGTVTSDQHFDVKNKDVYYLNYIPFISHDMGINYSPFFLDSIPSSFPSYISATADRRLLFYDLISQSYMIIDRQADAEILEFNSNPINHSVIETGYENNNIYYLSYDDNDALEFNQSSDGQTWTATTLDWFDGRTPQIHVDHLDNIYVYSTRVVGMSSDQGLTWIDITPQDPEIKSITSLFVSPDNYIFVSAIGKALFRSSLPIKEKNNLKIVFFEDSNDNCTYDTGEAFLQNFRAQIAPNSISVSDESGEIYYESNFSELAVTPLLDNNIFQSCFGTQIVKWTDEIAQEIFFPITYKEECAQIELGAFSAQLTICELNEYKISISNTGSFASENLQLTIELDEHFEYVDCDFDLDQLTGQTAIINIPAVQPGKSISGNIYFNLSCNLEEGSEHCLSVTPLLTNECSSPNSRQSVLECINNSSLFKSSAKVSLSGGNVNERIVTEDKGLNYEIRFQNTQNDTISHLSISDIISPNFILESLYPISASHPYNYRIEHQELIVDFPQINLPPQNVSKTQSAGFFKFHIDVKPSTNSGEILDNSAIVTYNTDLYEPTDTTFNLFKCQNVNTLVYDTICEGQDHGGHTMTGTHHDMFKTKLGCDSSRTLHLTVYAKNHPACLGVTVDDYINKSVKLFPNPVHSKLNISSEKVVIKKVEVTTFTGESYLNRKVNENLLSLPLEALARGVYFIHIELDNGDLIIKRFIKL